VFDNEKLFLVSVCRIWTATRKHFSAQRNLISDTISIGVLFACIHASVKISTKMTTAEPLTEEQEVFLKHIQKRGLKRTSQRDLILDVFLRTEEHLSNEDLYRLVQQEDPTVGQTTVYRTLKLLTEAGLAREVRFGDGRTHYEHNYKHQHHDHMICSECGKIIEFFSAELEALQDAMAAQHRFEITQHLLRIIGICADCQRLRQQHERNLTVGS